MSQGYWLVSAYIDDWNDSCRFKIGNNIKI